VLSVVATRPAFQTDRMDSNCTALAASEDFDSVVLPHLDAAYRLARWMTRNEHDAEDVVQEASLRAFQYFGTFVGGSGRAWFLQIVRNTCYGWHARSVDALTDSFDEEHDRASSSALDPEALLLQTDGAALIALAMRALSDRFRELLVLRELEGLSYRELADVMCLPIGTVMSGLSRARRALRRALEPELARRGLARRNKFSAR
jgi:RNA polymerase sigma-70 factor (ECF subfamily)